MATKQEIELLIKASDTTSKKTFGAASQAVDQLTKSVLTQTAAIESGDTSAADLTKTLNDLKQAGTELAREQGLVSFYQSVSDKFEAATATATELRQAASALASAQVNSNTVTKDQAKQLAAAESAANKAEAQVTRLAKSLDTYGQKLTAAGIDSNNLVAVTEAISEQALRVGSAMATASAAIESFDEVSQAGAQQRQQQLLKEQAYVNDLNAAYKEMAATEAQQNLEKQATDARLATEAYQAFNAAVTRGVQAMKEQSQLDEFQAIAARALSAEAGLDAFDASAVRAVENTTSLRDSLNSIIAPGDQATKTIGGLQTRVEQLAVEVGDASKPFANYQAQIAGIGKAQSALLSQGALIDQYRDQADAVERSAVTLSDARAALVAYATEMQTADAPSKEMISGLKQQQQALQQALTGYQNSKNGLAQLATQLDKAGISTNDLVKSEAQLKSTAQVITDLQNKLSAKQTGQGQAFSFLGLSPYALTNLGYQVNDVVTQLASGTSIEQTFAQQGGQILQIFPGIFAALVEFIPLIAVAVVSFGSLFLAIKRVTDLQASVREFSGELASMSDGGAYNAKALATDAQAIANFGGSLKDARSAVADFVNAGLDPSRIIDFGKAAQDLVTLTGVKLPDAAQKMAKGFSGGYDSIVQLDKEFDFLTAAERIQIQAMFDSGDAAGARSAAFDAFYLKVEAGAQKAKGPWSEAWVALKTAIGAFFDGLANLTGLNALGQVIDGIAGKVAELAKNFNLAAENQAKLKAANGGQDISDDDLKYLTALSLAEGGQSGALGAAAVVRNRSARSGKNIRDVINAPGQFGDDNTGTFVPTTATANFKSILASSSTSQVFLTTLEQIRDLIKGGSDPTNGAVNFYAPGLQASKGQKAPGFAQPNLLSAVGGPTNFYRGTFPGDQDTTTLKASQAQAKASDDLKRAYDEQRASITGVMNDQQRLDQARKEATRAVESAGGNPQSPEGVGAVNSAVQNEQLKIRQENAQKAIALAQQLAGIEASSASAQDQSLQKATQAVDDRFDAIRQKITELQNEHLPSIKFEGADISLDQAKQMLATWQATAEMIAGIKVLESQLTDIDAQREAKIKSVNDDLAAGRIDAVAANTKIATITAQYVPKLQAVAKSAHDFANGLSAAAQQSPQIEALLAKVDVAPKNAVAESIKDQITNVENGVNTLVTQRDDAFKALNDQLTQPGANYLDIVNQAIALQGKWNPLIADAADKAAALAKSLGGATPSPAITSVIAKFNIIATQARTPSATNGPAAGIANKATTDEENDLNKVIAQRNSLVTTYNDLETAGALSDADRRTLTQKAYTDSAAEITDLIAKTQALLDTQLKNHDITQQAYDAETAKLKLLGTQATYVDENFKSLRNTIINSFASDTVTAFDSITTAIGAAIDGTENWKDAIGDIGNAALTFFSSFLKQIADALIQMLALQAIKNLPGLSGLTSGILDFTGLGAGAATLTVASGTLTAASGALDLSAGTVGLAAADMFAAAVALQAAADTEIVANTVGLFHGGGKVGTTGGQRRKGVSPGAWVGAPRFHDGFNNDEMAAVLQRGETVRTVGQEAAIQGRLAAKGGNNGGSGGVRVLNVLDPAEILNAAMATPKGEKVLVNHVSQNTQKYQSILGIK